MVGIHSLGSMAVLQGICQLFEIVSENSYVCDYVRFGREKSLSLFFFFLI